MTSIHVGFLGPPRVAVDDEPVSLAGRPLLIAIRLALAGRNPVPARRLLDDVWGPDRDGDGALRVSLTRLRQTLGADLLERRDDGYVFSKVSTDATRFELLVRHARDRSITIEQRIAVYDESLALWTGRALAGVEQLPWVEAEAARLDELREQATDERFELRLLVDDAVQVVPDLRAAMATDPLRERRAELLAMALYRAGRQTDALAAVRRVGDALRDELGLEPGPAIRDLEYRILAHDPTLLESPLTARSTLAADTESRLRAATSLARVGAYSEALAIIDEAELEAGVGGDRASVATCLLTRAVTTAMSGTGDPDPLIDRARDIGRELRDGRLLARCALTRFGSGAPTDLTTGLVELIEPIELLPATAPERVDLLCAAAVMVILVDKSDTPERLLSAVVEVDDAQHSVRSSALLAAARSLVAATRGDDRDLAESHANRSFELAHGSDDPQLVVVASHAVIRSRYMRGDLAGVDEVLGPLLGAARTAMMPFAVVRVGLCQTTNAIARGEIDRAAAQIEETRTLGERHRTINTTASLFGQRLLVLRERGELATVLPELRQLAARSSDQWYLFETIRRMVEPAGASLLEFADDVPRDIAFLTFTAVAAEVALLTGDVELATWCAPHLDAAGDDVIATGLGTILLGFAPYFAGLAHWVAGDPDGGVDRLERARSLAAAAGAHLWEGHAAAALARVLGERKHPADLDRARELIDAIMRNGALNQSPRLQEAMRAASRAMSDSSAGPRA